jgi:hypothetical protein
MCAFVALPCGVCAYLIAGYAMRLRHTNTPRNESVCVDVARVCVCVCGGGGGNASVSV